MIKKGLFLLFIFISVSVSVTAQWRVGVNYLFSDYTLNNLQVSGQYDFNKRHSLLVGIKFNPNNDTLKPVFRYYYRNFYADDFWGKLGGILEYKYYLLYKSEHKLYAFYNTQILRKKSKSLNNITSLGGSGPREPTIDLPAVNVWENHVGLGLEFNFEDILSLFGGIGGGITHVNLLRVGDKGSIGAPIVFGGGRRWEFSYIANIGILVNIGQKEEEISRKNIIRTNY